MVTAGTKTSDGTKELLEREDRLLDDLLMDLIGLAGSLSRTDCVRFPCIGCISEQPSSGTVTTVEADGHPGFISAETTTRY